MPDGTGRRRSMHGAEQGGPAQWTDDDAATLFYQRYEDADAASVRWGQPAAVFPAPRPPRPVAPPPRPRWDPRFERSGPPVRPPAAFGSRTAIRPPVEDFGRGFARVGWLSYGAWFWIVSMATAGLTAWISLTVAPARPAATTPGSVAAASQIAEGFGASAALAPQDGRLPLPATPLALPPPAQVVGQPAAESTVKPRLAAMAKRPSPHRSAIAPARKPPQRSTPTAERGDGLGVLRINSLPWSEIYIDGRKVGTTPQLDLAVESGRHKIKLINPEFGLVKGFTIDIKAGKTLTKVIQFD